MKSELERVCDVRPVVAPPSAEVRQGALQQLLAAIEDEPPGLHAHRGPRAAVEPARKRAVHLRRGSSGRRDPRPRTGRRLLPTLVPAAVVAVAVAVAVGALGLSGRHRPGTRGPSSAGTAATILDATGAPLIGAGAATALPAPITAALRHRYGTQTRSAHTVRTTLDLSLEGAGQRSLSRSITANHAVGGAFVAMDPSTGAVVAIGTASGRGATRRQRRLDRAVSVAAPVGGVFRPITGLAALIDRAWSPAQTFEDSGEVCVPRLGACVHDAGQVAYGRLDLATALTVDSTDFFDNLGYRTLVSAARSRRVHPRAIESVAGEIGLAGATGIDLPGESSGRLPSPPPMATSPRTIGQTIALAEGDDGLEVTPIQVAVAYSALANGGTVVVPHLAGPPAIRRRLVLPAPDLAAVRAGLRGSAVGLKGRVGSTERVFRGFGEPVAGVPGTGTLLHGRTETTDAWYAGYVPAGSTRRPLVVVVLVQGGGFGSIAAAPVARQIFSQWDTGTPGPYRPGDARAP